MKKILIVSRDIEFNGGIGFYLKESIPYLIEKKDLEISIMITRSISDSARDYFRQKNIKVKQFPGLDFIDRQEPPEIFKQFIYEYKPEICILHNFISPESTMFLKKHSRVYYFYHTLNRFCFTGSGVLRTDKHGTHELIPCWKCYFNIFIRNCWSSKDGQRNIRHLSVSDMQKYLKLADGHIVTSEYLRKQLEINGIESVKIHKVPMFPIITKSRDSAVKDMRKVLYLGRITREKGAHLIADIFKNIKTEYNLEIIGSGYYIEDLKKDIIKNNLSEKIIVRGWVQNQEDISRKLAESAVTIIPSVWPEPFGLVGLESLLNNTPVIGFKIGGIPEYIHHDKSGYLIDTFDLKSFGEKIKFLLENPEISKKMGQSGEKLVAENFTVEKHVNSLLNFIDYIPGKVSAVIINFNGEQYLTRVIESLKRQTYKNIEIVVVDNNSLDSSRKLLEKTGGIRTFFMKRNLGIGPAVNAIVTKLDSEYLLLMNMDIELNEDYIEKMIRNFSDPEVFSVDSHSVNSAGKPLHGKQELLSKRFMNLFLRGYVIKTSYPKKARKTLFGCAAHLMFNRGKLVDLGGFDDLFFLEWEDFYICRKAKKRMDLKNIYEPEAICSHKVGGSEKNNELLMRNKKEFNLIRKKREFNYFRNKLMSMYLFESFDTFLAIFLHINIITISGSIYHGNWSRFLNLVKTDFWILRNYCKLYNEKTTLEKISRQST